MHELNRSKDTKKEIKRDKSRTHIYTRTHTHVERETHIHRERGREKLSLTGVHVVEAVPNGRAVEPAVLGRVVVKRSQMPLHRAHQHSLILFVVIAKIRLKQNMQYGL